MDKLNNIHEILFEMYDEIVSILNDGNQLNEPEIHYHYTSASALKSILENEALWFSNGKFMNDNTDLSYVIDVINAVSHETLVFNDDKYFVKGYDAVKKYEFYIEKVNLLIKTLLGKLEKVFLLSTSDNADSLMLWSNYSSDEGYNIGLEKSMVNSILQNLTLKKLDDGNYLVYTDNFRLVTQKGDLIDGRKDFSIFCNQVIYNSEKQKAIVHKYLSILRDVCCQYFDAKDEALIEFIDNHIIETLAAQLSIYSVFIKNPSFQQEQEYRIAFMTHSETDIKDMIKFRVCNGVFIPYIEVKFNPGDSKCRRLPLKSITIGPKNNLEIAENGLRSILDTLNYEVEKISIYKSHIPLRY